MKVEWVWDFVGSRVGSTGSETTSRGRWPFFLFSITPGGELSRKAGRVIKHREEPSLVGHSQVSLSGDEWGTFGSCTGLLAEGGTPAEGFNECR